jgi:hypothetical protein
MCHGHVRQFTACGHTLHFHTNKCIKAEQNKQMCTPLKMIRSKTDTYCWTCEKAIKATAEGEEDKPVIGNRSMKVDKAVFEDDSSDE